MPAAGSAPHRWNFVRSGGLDQAALDSGADLPALGTLDLKLWVALACPVRGLELDEKTLGLIDTDKDGRIRPPEVVAAVQWACARIKDPGSLLRGADTLPLDALADSPEGRATRETAEWVLAAVGKTGSTVTAEDALAAGKSLSSVPDAGLSPESAARAFAAVDAVRSKIDDYFVRTGLAGFDAAAVPAVNRTEDQYRTVTAGTLSAQSPELAALPLARVEPGRALPLLEGVNPAWAAALAELHEAAVTPIFGGGTTTLTPAAWATLTGRLQPQAADLESVASKAAAAADLEKLALFYRDLGTLLRNFVNFSDFYSKSHKAVFQAGTLYMDGRACHLCLRVDDVSAHADFATMSRVYVAYLDCKRPSGVTTKIAACFTQGDSDYLFVGRNGVFYDRDGLDWDATIVRLATSPVSIREAFWAPYKKVSTFVQDQFSKFAASKAVSPTSAAQTFDIAKFAGIFAAVGLAFGAIGGAVTSIASGLLKLAAWKIPFAVLAALLLISGPSMILAALKLRQRTLGPLLEGSGWAINGRVGINFPLGAALTERTLLPPGARRTVDDPYRERISTGRRLTAAFVIAILAWLLVAQRLAFWPF